MDKDFVWNLLTVLEIIGVEFALVWILSKRKHGFVACLLTYAAVTIPIILFMRYVATRIPGFGDGSGRFMVLGVFYFIPALLNYGGDWKDRLITAFYVFSYALAVFFVSVRIGYIFPTTRLAGLVLVVQTVMFGITAPLFLPFSRKVVARVQAATPRQKWLLLSYTIVGFFLIIFYNFVLVESSSMIARSLVYLLLVHFIMITYRLVVSYLQTDADNYELNRQMQIDRLTRLGNRVALRHALDKFVRAEQEFYLLFMDLNHFKSVNDRYGHGKGDQYLVVFAEALVQATGPASPCFRLAGDEFICLTRDPQMHEKLSALTLNPWTASVPEFLGVSVGMAHYPKDATEIVELLAIADRAMYRKKGIHDLKQD